MATKGDDAVLVCELCKDSDLAAVFELRSDCHLLFFLFLLLVGVFGLLLVFCVLCFFLEEVERSLRVEDGGFFFRDFFLSFF